MEIRQLRTFQAVARHLSFNKAAERLNYAQSSISAQIIALEEELNVRLFDRLGRRILLTSAGERLLGYADRILNLADETRAEITEAKEPRGSLTIRIPESIGIYRLAPVLKQFRSMYPKVRLTLTTCAHEGLQQDLRKGLTDLAFLLTDSIKAADIHAEVLGFEDIVMVAHPGHPLASKRVVRNKDLEGQAVLLSNVDCSYRRVFEMLLDEKKVRVDKAIVFHSIAALKACLMEGYGLTILPEVAVKEDILSKKLVSLKWEENKLETANLMIWYKERWLSPTLQAFMKITRNHFKCE